MDNSIEISEWPFPGSYLQIVLHELQFVYVHKDIMQMSSYLMELMVDKMMIHHLRYLPIMDIHHLVFKKFLEWAEHYKDNFSETEYLNKHLKAIEETEEALRRSGALADDNQEFESNGLEETLSFWRAELDNVKVAEEDVLRLLAVTALPGEPILSQWDLLYFMSLPFKGVHHLLNAARKLNIDNLRLAIIIYIGVLLKENRHLILKIYKNNIH